MRSVGASQQVPTRSRNYRKRSREIVDNARRYFSLKKFEGSSSSRFEIEPVVRSLICVPHTVSVEKVSTLLKMIVGLQHILVSKMLESRDRLNASNIVIHELRRRIQEYEGSQNRNGDEEDGLVTSEAVLGAGGSLSSSPSLRRFLEGHLLMRDFATWSALCIDKNIQAIIKIKNTCIDKISSNNLTERISSKSITVPVHVAIGHFLSSIGGYVLHAPSSIEWSLGARLQYKHLHWPPRIDTSRTLSSIAHILPQGYAA
ncbi:hypothetical protein LguiB_004925 [Lonicera macranthoides]